MKTCSSWSVLTTGLALACGATELDAKGLLADAESPAPATAPPPIAAPSGSGSRDASQTPGVSQDAGPAEGGVPGPRLRFVALGDSGKGNQGQLDVAKAIRARCDADPCDFAVLLGDNIYDSGAVSVSDPQWQSKFEGPYRDLAFPFYPVLGNHDYGNGGAGGDWARGQVEIDYTASSTKWRLPAAYHHFSPARELEMVVLDTEQLMFERVAEQKRDVASWLASSTATWKIALGHHPYRSNGPHGNAGRYEGVPSVPLVSGTAVKSFFDTTICGKVDLYLSGHDHSRQWLREPCAGTTELIVSGAGATVTSLPGSNPTHFQAATLGFVLVTLAGPTLTVEFVDTTGKTEFSRALAKKTGP